MEEEARGGVKSYTLSFFVVFYHGTLCLEDTEGLLSRGLSLWLVSDNIETNSLGKRTALSNGDDITLLDCERWRAVNSNVLVTLFETTVLDNVVQVVPSNDDGSLHLGGNDQTRQDSSTNRNITCEGALFVYIVSFNGSIWCLDTKTDVLDKTHGLLASVANGTLTGDKDGILLLVSLLVLVALRIYRGDTSRLKRHDFLFAITARSENKTMREKNELFGGKLPVK